MTYIGKYDPGLFLIFFSTLIMIMFSFARKHLKMKMVINGQFCGHLQLLLLNEYFSKLFSLFKQVNFTLSGKNRIKIVLIDHGASYL